MKKVVLSEKAVKAYVAEAKRAFPRETYGFLMGDETETQKKVEYIHIPEDQDIHCTKFQVNLPTDWIIAARQTAKALGMQVLGDIHSHCYEGEETQYCDLSLSYTDIKDSDFIRINFKCPEPLVGIAVLTKPSKRIGTRIIFYPEIKIYKAELR